MGTIKHNHNHDHCQHERLRYCSHCGVVYCLDCNKEWGNYTYWSYSYPNYPYYGDGNSWSKKYTYGDQILCNSQGIPAAGDVSLPNTAGTGTVTCNHGVTK